MIPFGVYVHFPFCRSKCPYCDFNSYAKRFDEKALATAYAAALRKYAKMTADKRVTSVFFGGGTPSLASAGLISFILREIRSLWDVAENAEISLEGNPDSLSDEKIDALRAAGVDRLSVGVQSLNDAELRFLGRIHSAKTALSVLKRAQTVFPVVSADFIYALPDQTMNAWLETLNAALELNLKHLSLYQLTLEEGSFFERQGKIVLPDEETSAMMFEKTDAVMTNAGYTHYEVSNFAKGEQNVCRHNMIYWQGGDYVGVGAGAGGRFAANGVFYATESEKNPALWLKDPTGDAREVLTEKDRADELLITGLRLEKGIDAKRFKEIVGKEYARFIDEDACRRLCEEGFLTADGDGLRATKKGRLILNGLIVQLAR